MIIDFHTHIFPPEVKAAPEEYRRRDPLFAAMYGGPRAAVATAEDLLAEMDEAGVAASVALGFAWADAGLVSRHNEYLLEAAAKSGGRIVPFAAVNMADAGTEDEVERAAAAGARGLGELRPEDQGWDLNGPAGARLAGLARRHGLVLLFHVTEPVGHAYPGKGGLRLEAFYRFVAAHPGLTVVGAHLAGGLPFYAEYLPPDDPAAAVYADTAAWHLIYRAAGALGRILDRGPGGRLLFGSDFPLVGQREALSRLREGAGEGRDGVLEGLLGANAARLLGRRP